MSYTYKQIQSGSAGAGVTSCYTPTFNSTAGSLLIAFAFGSAAATITITDVAANTWYSTGAQIGAFSSIAQTFYAYNTTALSGGNVAANFSVAQNYPQIIVLEYAGILQTSDPFLAAGGIWDNHSDPSIVGPTSNGAIYANAVGPMSLYPCLGFGIAVSASGSKPSLIGYGGINVRSNTIVSGYAVCGDYEVTAANNLVPRFDNNGATTNSYLMSAAAFAETGAIPPATNIGCGYMQTYAMR